MSLSYKEMEEEIELEDKSTGERTTIKRKSGGSTHYYSFPECSEAKDIIRYKKMNHAEGEMFCSLLRLHDNGEYKRNLEKILFYVKSELEYQKDNA